ncbi:MAG: hypothetical protein IPO30_07720 [Hyphomonadaceae bacterium]|nr:hypothetical protein [Hyphomonadaceae bacterium]
MTKPNITTIEVLDAEDSRSEGEHYFSPVSSPTSRMDINAATREMLSVKATDVASRAFGKQNLVDGFFGKIELSRINRNTTTAINSLLADEMVKTYAVKIQMLAEGIRGHAVMEHNNLDNKLQLIVTEAFGEHLLNLNEKLADTTFKAALARQKNADRNGQARRAGVMNQRAYALAEDVAERSFARRADAAGRDRRFR